MRHSFYLTVATAAVVMLILLSGCEKAETQQQGVQQQGGQGAASGAGSAAEASENLSDGLDEALAELDTLKGLEG